MINFKRIFSTSAALIALLLYSTSANALDSDNDTIPDEMDNCTNIPNIEQYDSNNNGFGDRCDADFNSSCITELSDFVTFRAKIGTSIQKFDFNSDGDVDFEDYYIFKSLYGQSPGPSGITPVCKPATVP